MWFVLLIGMGGFGGAILRYWISGWIQNGIVSEGLITEEKVKIILYEGNDKK